MTSLVTAENRGALAWTRRPIGALIDRLIGGYQRWISPLLPPACRFTPSCSSYARTALRHHHTPRAIALITWRILRCQPLCAGGEDPVPPGPWTITSLSPNPTNSESA